MNECVVVVAIIFGAFSHSIFESEWLRRSGQFLLFFIHSLFEAIVASSGQTNQRSTDQLSQKIIDLRLAQITILGNVICDVLFSAS